MKYSIVILKLERERGTCRSTLIGRVLQKSPFVSLEFSSKVDHSLEPWSLFIIPLFRLVKRKCQWVCFANISFMAARQYCYSHAIAFIRDRNLRKWPYVNSCWGAANAFSMLTKSCKWRDSSWKRRCGASGFECGQLLLAHCAATHADTGVPNATSLTLFSNVLQSHSCGCRKLFNYAS